MNDETKVLMGLSGIGAALLISACLSGCSFKVEALYHGQTPVGIEDRKATQLRATLTDNDDVERESRNHKAY